jgi:hypothetical protein
MSKHTKARPASRYRPVTTTVRYEQQRERADESLRRTPSVGPRLGPYEFRYPIAHGYTSGSHN